MLELQDGTKKSDKHLITHIDLHKTKQQVGLCIIRVLLVLGQTTSKLGLIRLTTAWTWGDTTTFPLIVYSVPLHEAHIQMAFCPNGNLEIAKDGTPATLGPHNFV